MQIFRHFADSFDHYLVARGGCNPLNVAIFLTITLGVLTAISILPSLQSVVGFNQVALPFVLFIIGGIFSLLTWFTYPNRVTVSIFQSLDIAFNSTGLISLSVLATAPVAYYFAAIWIVVAVYWATTFGVSFIGTVSLLAGPALVLYIYDTGPFLYVSVALGGMLWAVISRTTVLKQIREHRAIDILSYLDTVMDGQRSPLLDNHRVKMIGILHEAKNDLTPAQWNIEYLEKMCALSLEDQQVLDETKACIESTLHSLYCYLDNYRDQIHESRQFGFVDLIETVKLQLPQNSGFQFRSDEDDTLNLDGRLDDIRLALMTIIENAIDAGATYFEINRTSAPTNGAVTFHLRDNGPGLPQKAKDRLFMPFNTCGKRNGVGLGLYLAHRLITANGGEIMLEHSSTAGTIFQLKLPLTSDQSVSPIAEA